MKWSKNKIAEKGKKINFYGRTYRNYDKNRLRLDLLDHDWGLFYNSRDTDKLWEEIENLFLTMLDKMCPFKE